MPGDPAAPEFRPTCHYAYHPCDDAVLGLHETFGSGRIQTAHHILGADEIVERIVELGVLLYGHAKNALWYGSRLSNAEARRLAPHQNATGLQVTSAGMVWALENPEAGIVEAEEMDHDRWLDKQRPSPGPVEAHYTDWAPIDARQDQFPEERYLKNPWSFRNGLVRSLGPSERSVPGPGTPTRGGQPGARAPPSAHPRGCLAAEMLAQGAHTSLHAALPGGATLFLSGARPRDAEHA